MRRNKTLGFEILVLALLAGACASTETATVEPSSNPTREAILATPEPVDALDSPEAADTRSEDSKVEAAIERALAEGWGELRILSECIIDDAYESVEIFGSGAAIWGKNAQFSLTYDQIRQHLEAIRDGGFVHLERRYGGRTANEIELSAETGASPRNATKVTCRLVLELDGTSKQVMQLFRGEQSAELRQLAEHILDRCRAPASSGVIAESLDDGLAKAAAGKLAPETVEILFHHKPTADEGSEGWLLRLKGLEVSSRTFRPGAGYAETLLLELHPDDLAALLRLLSEQAPSGWPVNLYAESYTDLKINVLDQRQSVQARQFADLTPTLHGEKQQRFDRIFDRLQELHRRVQAEGQPAPQG